MNKNQIFGWLVIAFAIFIFVALYLEGYRINKKVKGVMFADIEGREYKTVRIGGQIWMAENLKVSKTNDGNNIKSYYPNNDRSNLEKYGRLYTWNIAKSICPEDWRLPTDNDWQILRNYLGSHAGAKLKDTLNWTSPGFNTSNEAHFNALPAGFADIVANNVNSFFGTKAVFWSSTQKDSSHVWCRMMINNVDSMVRVTENPQNALSVRCVKK
jgi:uncharacterized protein (TIGR02145 family)